MGGVMGDGLPASYRRWQEVLASSYWDNPGAPVTMCIDDAELSRLQPDQVPDLVAAVAELLPRRPASDMFWRVSALETRWAAGERSGPPPTLPLLGLTVLAASRMDRGDGARPSNYYLRLAQVLAPALPGVGTEELREVLRRPSEPMDGVARMWESLHRWVGSRWGQDVSTIRTHPTFRRTGYPISQALLRGSDRSALTHFFAALGLPGADIPDEDSLLLLLRLWSQHGHGLSSRMEQVLVDSNVSGLLAGMVRSLAASWDGTVRMSDGRPRLAVRLVLDLDLWTAHWIVEASDRVDREVVRGVVPGAGSVELAVARDVDRPWMVTEGSAPVTQAALRDGFRLQGPSVAAEFRRSADLIAFRLDPDAGAWVSVASTVPFEEHMLAVPTGSQEVLAEVLEEAAPGYRMLRGAPAGMQGWALFERVVVADVRELERAFRCRGLDPGRFLGLRPEPAPRPKLVDGLTVPTSVSGGVYMAGGEPDLLLPVGADSRRVEASLDGEAQPGGFQATGLPIPLRNLPGGHLTGRHEIQADGYMLPFTVVERNPARPQPGGLLGWNGAGQLVGGVGPHAIEGAGVSLAIAGEDIPEPILCRRGQDETWFLLQNGRCVPVVEPPPTVLRGERAAPPLYFEAVPPPGAAWLAARKRGAWKVRPLAALAPGFAPLRPGDREVWGQLVNSGDCRDRLWRAYVQSWESQRDR